MDTSRPSPRTKWTRLVPPPVLTGHVSSTAQVLGIMTLAKEHAGLAALCRPAPPPCPPPCLVQIGRACLPCPVQIGRAAPPRPLPRSMRCPRHSRRRGGRGRAVGLRAQPLCSLSCFVRSRFALSPASCAAASLYPIFPPAGRTARSRSSARTRSARHSRAGARSSWQALVRARLRGLPSPFCPCPYASPYGPPP